MGYVYAFGPCYVCHRYFSFNAETVPSVYVDLDTGVPPDVGGTDMANAIRRPLCAECVATVNAARVAAGVVAISVPRDAYGPAEAG